MPSLIDRIQHAWNAFNGNDIPSYNYGEVSSIRPDRPKLTKGNDRSLINAIYNRIAMDVAAVEIEHVDLDEQLRFINTRDSYLNDCLTIEANIDQTARAFKQDIVMSMFDEGVVAVVPVETTTNPKNSNAYDIVSMRTGKIEEWMPDHVKVKVYNEKTGKKQSIVLPKKMVAIIENPLYSIMNEPNSVLQRLLRKMNLLDFVDEQSSAGKLDMIIQLPYVIKTEARRKQAEERRKELETQLAGSKYGIAYTDGTEHITQLNRPLENNLMKQVEYLTELLYSQLGITTEILNGTANSEVMTEYNNRIIEPIVSAIVDEFKRKFLSKTARTQRQSIIYFRDPFRLIPVNKIAETADAFTRNEIMTSNEFRQIIGLKPYDSPDADALRNKNLNMGAGEMMNQQMAGQEGYDENGQPIEGQEGYDENGQPLQQSDNSNNYLMHSNINSVKKYIKVKRNDILKKYYAINSNPQFTKSKSSKTKRS